MPERTQAAVYLTGNYCIDRFCLAAHNDRLRFDTKRLEHCRRNNVLITARAGGSCIRDLMRFAVVDQIINVFMPDFCGLVRIISET